MSAKTVLLCVYAAAAVLEVIGILVTVNTYLEGTDDGFFKIHQAESRWQAVRGPFFIVAGVLVGLAGNVAALYVAL